MTSKLNLQLALFLASILLLTLTLVATVETNNNQLSQLLQLLTIVLMTSSIVSLVLPKFLK